MALAPLRRRADGTLEFSGGEFTDALDVLALDPNAARLIGCAVAGRSDRLELSWIREGGHALGPFADGLRSSGMRVSKEPIIVSPRLALPTSFDAYLAGLPGKERHELRRKMRRLESVGAVSFAYLVEPARAAGLERFVAWHRATPGEKGTFLTPEREAFFRELARSGGEAGWWRLGELRLEDRPIASVFAFELDGVVYAYNSAVAPDSASLSPGVLLHAHAIRDAIERGLSAYDFLRGDERYKYDLGGTDVQLYRLTAERDA
ncbi:MAG TPA: GNAT family N-acetyltransferase [Candidatus Limnocylindria bacterium]|nr:GNAT family N-acetyltransferase [Candidatus Limnocylindria bacterium]